LLESFSNQSGADAAGTDLDCSDCTVSDCLYLLKVRIPDSTGFVIGMTYVVAKAGTFAADYTCS